MTIQEMVDTLNNDGNNFTLCLQLEELIDKNNNEEAINYIQKHFNCNNEMANQCFIEFKKQIYSEIKKIRQESRASLTPQQIARANAVAREWQNKPKCPTCSSVNLKKISTASKAVNTAMFGLLGTKRNKAFHCNNCGYEW